MVETDLKTLFSLVRDGNREAFGAIYCQLKQPVFTICWRIVQSKDAAEDITHDVFVKLFVSPPDPSVRNPRAWVFRMARNLAIDALRRNAHTDAGELPADAVSFHDDLDLKLDVESAIQALPCSQREILALHLSGGLSFAEIASIVKLSLPAVYRTYRKALKRLRDELNGGAL